MFGGSSAQPLTLLAAGSILRIACALGEPGGKSSCKMRILKFLNCTKQESNSWVFILAIRKHRHTIYLVSYFFPLYILCCQNKNANSVLLTFLNIIINCQKTEPFLFSLDCMHAQLLQLCPTLCDPVDCSSAVSSVHGILQARILETVAMPSSRGSSWLRNWTSVSFIVGGFFTHWTTWEAL